MEDEWNDEEEKTKEYKRRKVMIWRGPEYEVGREKQLQERLPVCYPPIRTGCNLFRFWWLLHLPSKDLFNSTLKQIQSFDALFHLLPN